MSEQEIADFNRLETHLTKNHGYSLSTTQGLSNFEMSAAHRAAHEEMPVGTPHSHENEVQRVTWGAGMSTVKLRVYLRRPDGSTATIKAAVESSAPAGVTLQRFLTENISVGSTVLQVSYTLMNGEEQA